MSQICRNYINIMIKNNNIIVKRNLCKKIQKNDIKLEKNDIKSVKNDIKSEKNDIKLEKKEKKSKKWIQGTLFERLQKIQSKVDIKEKSPIEILFPKTFKKYQVYTPETLRCGVLGIKLGLTQLWHKPEPLPVLCTMIHIKECQVIQHLINKNINDFIKHTLIVGCSNIDENSTSLTLNEKQRIYFGSLKKYGIKPKLYYRGFTVHPNNILKPRTVLNASHFVVDQKIQIVSRSKDKGFLGVMQRWNFKGLNASHGVSKAHRKPGSIVGVKARIIPRRKMAGHHGLYLKCINGLKIVRINHKYNVIYIKGSIPGPIGQIISIRDWWNQPKKIEIPYPTCKLDNSELKDDVFADDIHDPSEMYELVQKEKS